MQIWDARWLTEWLTEWLINQVNNKLADIRNWAIWQCGSADSEIYSGQRDNERQRLSINAMYYPVLGPLRW